jgi:hypothetical protein
MTSVALATEDELSEAIGERLLAGAAPGLQPDLKLRRGGFGYLRSGMDKWCALAITTPVVVLTDLDRQPCPRALIDSWLGKRRQPQNLLLRVAVHEVEAWLLADHEAIQHLFGKTARLPPNPDVLVDPKQQLLQLAQRGKRRIRDQLVASTGTIAAQGLAYNSRLCDFVRSEWCPERASIRSESLRRTRLCINALATRLQQS